MKKPERTRSNRLQYFLKSLKKYRNIQKRISSGNDYNQDKLLRKLQILRKRILTINRKWTVGIATSVILAWMANPVHAQTESFDLSTLDGSNGYEIIGQTDDAVGFSVSSAGDVNGDGFDDIIVGAPYADEYNGAAYVVFGDENGSSSSLDLSSIDGTNGFKLSGDTYSLTATTLSTAGDINGDGFDDVLIGVFGDNRHEGIGYIVYGKDASFPAEVELNSLSGSEGFIINTDVENDYVARTVSGGGDFNGDGFDDIIIGGEEHYYGSGGTYVVFGRAEGFTSPFELSSLDGTNGVILVGDFESYSGMSVSFAGDVNGDGFDDIISSGLYSYDTYEGHGYVVFGKSDGFSAELNMRTLDGTDGFIINGLESNYTSVSVRSAGDFNGDGFDDILLHAPLINNRYGENYVVFGKNSGFSASVDINALDGTNGFSIEGVHHGCFINMDTHCDDELYDCCTNVYRVINSASGAGDINGDGFDDIIVSSHYAKSFAGKSYVIFGHNSGINAEFDLKSIDGENGLTISGKSPDNYLGFSVSSAGDVNGDHVDDMLIGAPKASNLKGEVYVIYGDNQQLGIKNNIFSGQELSLFPNPAKDILTIDLKDTEHSAISISNMQGKQVKTLQGSFNGQVNIQVQDLPEGIYIISLPNGGGSDNYRFVKD